MQAKRLTRGCVGCVRQDFGSLDVGQSRALGQQDAEMLLSYLTVPYMRVPLIVSFFSTDDRIHSLQSRQQSLNSNRRLADRAHVGFLRVHPRLTSPIPSAMNENLPTD